MYLNFDRVFGLIVMLVSAMIVILFVLLFMCSHAHAKPNSIFFGDSIACGTGTAAHRFPKVCVVGASSCTILGWLPAKGSFSHAIVSAGINDSGACVAKIRATIRAKQIIWILPAPINDGRANVLKVLRSGDRTVSYACKGGCTKTNFHPGSYSKVWADVKKQW